MTKNYLEWGLRKYLASDLVLKVNREKELKIVGNEKSLEYLFK